jgi:hypothetical protein
LNLITHCNNLHKKRGKSANKVTDNVDSSSSEYLFDEDDQGDSIDDDDTKPTELPDPMVMRG